MMLGGVICGYCASGSVKRATPPASVMTMESTEAKIGRSMKKRENTGGPRGLLFPLPHRLPLLACRLGRGRRLVVGVFVAGALARLTRAGAEIGHFHRLRYYLRLGPHTLQAVHHDPLAGLQPFLDCD